VKRSSVLLEWLEQFLEDFGAVHELLKYELRGSDVKALTAFGNRSVTHCFHVSTRPVDGAKDILDLDCPSAM